jgi:U3 small nucleolar RNA-associated protein 13
LTSASDGLLKIWSIKTNESIRTYDEHDNKCWALCIDQNEDICVTGGADSKLIIWKNVTNQINEENQEKQNEIILNEQKLSNCLIDKNYKKALKLAIILDRPYKCYEILSELLNTENGCDDLNRILSKLRDDHLASLLKYATQWNTNSKYCHVAQAFIEIILNNYAPEQLLKFDNISSVIEQVLPYTGILFYFCLKQCSYKILKF